MAFYKILSHREILKFEMLFKPEMLSKYHIHVSVFFINFHDIEFSYIAFSQIEFCSIF